MTNQEFERARKISHKALEIIMAKPDSERTNDENYIISEALAIWEQTGEIRYLADFLVIRL